MSNQKVTVVAFTTEQNNTENMVEDLEIFSGKAAGVCYMNEDYLGYGIQDTQKALARAISTAERGHQSVFGHVHISFIVETNKIMAMTLNSLGVYNTSEKSARYTKMNPKTELEKELYEKWIKKFRQMVLNRYPDYDDSVLKARVLKIIKDTMSDVAKSAIVISNGHAIIMAHDGTNNFDNESIRVTVESLLENLRNDIDLPSYKIAQENARYLISVFTPTVMMYTVSFRQAMLIIDYLNKLSVDCAKNTSQFYKDLGDSAKELADKFLDAIHGEKVLGDIKNQSVRFFEYADENKGYNKVESIGDSYTLRYEATLAMMAQAQRHRTLRYTIHVGKIEDYKFYVPKIIRGTELEQTWLDDIKSVAYCTPQGTIVDVTEQGIFEDFVLKCKERLCGRAQLEIAVNTVNQAKKFIENKDKLCEYNQSLLDAITNTESDSAVARCRFKDFICNEGCRWGSKEGLTRLV